MKILNPAIRFKDRELNVLMDITGETYEEVIEQIILQGYKEDYEAWHEEGYQVIFNGAIQFMPRETVMAALG